MFYGCNSLKSIDLSNFDTSQVIYMGYIFYGCTKLEFIDLSNFDTSQVTDMSYMFDGCSSLESIDLSHFDMINCNSFYKMFLDISNIKYINIYYLKNDKIISHTFNNVNYTVFICRKDIIIDNPKVYNCCDSNFKTYDCISTPTTNNINQTNDDITNNNFKSSSLISTGSIIIIIAVGFAAILAIIIIIFCNYGCPCKKYANKRKKTFSPLPHLLQANHFQSGIDRLKPNIINSSNNNEIKTTIIEEVPNNEKNYQIIIIFENLNFGDSNILIDPEKTIDELIRIYFKKCKRLDLYGDKTISFLINSKTITPPYPKESIETLKNTVANSETIRIVVNDSDNKMKK